MINRLSHLRLGNISLITLVRCHIGTLFAVLTRDKYDTVSSVPRAIKMMSPRPPYDNLFILTNITSLGHRSTNYACKELRV